MVADVTAGTAELAGAVAEVAGFAVVAGAVVADVTAGTAELAGAVAGVAGAVAGWPASRWWPRPQSWWWPGP